MALNQGSRTFRTAKTLWKYVSYLSYLHSSSRWFGRINNPDIHIDRRLDIYPWALVKYVLGARGVAYVLSSGEWTLPIVSSYLSNLFHSLLRAFQALSSTVILQYPPLSFTRTAWATSTLHHGNPIWIIWLHLPDGGTSDMSSGWDWSRHRTNML